MTKYTKVVFYEIQKNFHITYRGVKTMTNEEIINLLKKLRLAGISSTFDERINQAKSNQLPYAEWFSLLLEDERSERDARALERRLKLATFEEQKTFEALQLSHYSAKEQKIIRELMCGRYLDKNHHIIIMGPTGTGKSHLAQALGHHACRQGKKVKFIRANQLWRQLKAARADDTWGKLFKRLVSHDLLIIDDFGLKPLSPMEAEDMYELIAERYLKKSLIFTSNRKIDAWVKLFPDPIIANAAMDRLAHHAHQIILDVDSFRRKNRPSVSK